MKTYIDLLEKEKLIQSADGNIKVFNDYNKYFVLITEILPVNFKDLMKKKYDYGITVYEKKTEMITEKVTIKHSKKKFSVDENGKLQKKGFLK